MALNGKSCPQDLREKGGNMMDSYEYCMIRTQAKQLSGWYGGGPIQEDMVQLMTPYG